MLGCLPSAKAGSTHQFAPNFEMNTLPTLVVPINFKACSPALNYNEHLRLQAPGVTTIQSALDQRFARYQPAYAGRYGIFSSKPGGCFYPGTPPIMKAGAYRDHAKICFGTTSDKGEKFRFVYQLPSQARESVVMRSPAKATFST